MHFRSPDSAALARYPGVVERLIKADRAHTVAIRAAHEFNNDLTVILNSVSTSLRTLGLDHPARADLLELQRAALRCAWTASGLLMDVHP